MTELIKIHDPEKLVTTLKCNGYECTMSDYVIEHIKKIYSIDIVNLFEYIAEKEPVTNNCIKMSFALTRFDDGFSIKFLKDKIDD